MKISTFFKAGLLFGAAYTLLKAFEEEKPRVVQEIKDAVKNPERALDKVDEAMLESFPASDPPAYR